MAWNHDAWTTDLTWFWLNATNYKHITTTAPNVLIPLLAAGSATPEEASGLSATGSWKCTMNVLDASLSKAYHVSRRIVLNPRFGLRFAWVDQHLAAHYAGTGILSNPANIYHGKNDFWGVGMRAGVESDWELQEGFKLFYNVFYSMLSGQFKTKNQFQGLSAPPAGTDPNTNLTDNFHNNVPNLEMALGLGWGMHFSKNRYYFELRAGYEFQMWWDQLNLRKFYESPVNTGNWSNDTISRGALSLNGFTLRAQLDL